jgi:hypothetical protein
LLVLIDASVIAENVGKGPTERVSLPEAARSLCGLDSCPDVGDEPIVSQESLNELDSELSFH